jgi:hypothetical protein
MLLGLPQARAMFIYSCMNDVLDVVLCGGFCNELQRFLKIVKPRTQ